MSRLQELRFEYKQTFESFKYFNSLGNKEEAMKQCDMLERIADQIEMEREN